MLKIRLRRTGAKKQPRYRVVVAESSAPRDGAYVEVLGWYNPQADPAQIQVDTDKAAEWIKRGAQPSERVAYLLKRAGTAAQPEAPPQVTPVPTPARARRTRAADQEKPSADEAPESAGSADTIVTDTTESEPTTAPESEGSAGAQPA